MEKEKLPLDQKYRFTKFEDMVGNESLITALQKVLCKEGRPHTYLLSGPKGCGKTTLARIIAKSLGASSHDTKELNIANTGGIDQARAIIENVQYAPLSGKSKVIILEEVHGANDKFQNCMLKVLEEPPKNAYFILCTTEPEKLIGTVRSRCTSFQVKSLTSKDIKFLVKRVLAKEKAIVSPEVIAKIADAADGCSREALVLLNKVIGLKSNVALEIIESNNCADGDTVKLFVALYSKRSWKEVASILKSMDKEDEAMRCGILTMCCNKLLNNPKGDPVASLMIDYFDSPFFNSKHAGFVNACFQFLLE